MCVICTIACGIWEAYRGYDFQIYLPWESFISTDRNTGSTIISLLVFLSYLIILNTVVPISLYVRLVNKPTNTNLFLEVNFFNKFEVLNLFVRFKVYG